MTTPIVTFFNNKGGVGKTSLVYHTAWMLSDLGLRTLVLDLDPQANLTAAFLDEDVLSVIFDASDPSIRSIFQALLPLMRVGDIEAPTIVPITPHLGFIPGDLALSRFEDSLAEQWGKCLGGQEVYRAFRTTAAFWSVAESAAASWKADLILFDVGPNLGALNRSALVATDHVVVPLAGDLFSIQGLRNLGPTLRDWRKGWQQRRSAYDSTDLALPTGHMRPAGYVVQQHVVRLRRPVQAYTRWMDRIPAEYRNAELGGLESPVVPGRVEADPECLAMFKHFRSLVPMGHEARKPIFHLRAGDGAIGSHGHTVAEAYFDFRVFVQRLLKKIGHPLAE